MVRFRLKKVGEATLEPSAASDAQAVLESARVPAEPRPIAGDAGLGAAQETLHGIEAWAASDPLRWRQIHEKLLSTYVPVWRQIEARDILVAWAAAHRALTEAKRELIRLEALGGQLTSADRRARGGRQADLSFWGRASDRFSRQAPAALGQDNDAERLLKAFAGEASDRTDS